MSESKAERTVGLASYESFARRYAAVADTKPHNAYYERPATLSLLPEVAGLRVLDAGCGPGIYTEWLVERGADVVAIDVTPDFVEITRDRVGDRAQVRVADLSQPLDFLPDGMLDLVLAPLSIDYLPDWRGPFAEFCRALKPGGLFVCSLGHPMADYIYGNVTDYFATELVTEVWRGFGEPFVTVQRYRRPLATLIDTLLEAGFVLERLLEPRPTPEFQAAEPEDYEKLLRQPGFLCFRARKSG